MGRVARQATWISLLTVVGMGLGFVNMALLFPRYLTPDQFGLARLVVSITVIVAQVASFGAENTVIRYFPYLRDGSRGHRGLFGVVLIIGTLGALAALLVLGLFNGHLARWFQNDSDLYGEHGLVVLPLVLSEVYYLLLRSFSRSVHRSIAPVFAREFLLRALQTVLIGAHVLWHLPFGLFIDLYALTFVVTTGVLAFDLWRAGQMKLGLGQIHIPRRMQRSMLRYGAFTFGSGMAGMAVGSIDQVMIGAMLHDGLSYVAYYSVAVFMASLVTVPARALMLPTVPILAEAWRSRDQAKIGAIYRRTASIQLVACSFILLGLWACMDPLFSLLKPGYDLGKPAFLVLGLAQMVALSQGVGGSIVSTSRNYWFDAVSGACLLVLNLALDYFFILWWGFVGAAWSSLVSVSLVVLFRVWFLRSRHGLWPYDGRTVLTLLLFAAVAFAVWKVPHATHPVVDIVLRAALVCTLFLPLVHWLRLAPELGDQVIKLFRRFRKLIYRA